MNKEALVTIMRAERQARELDESIRRCLPESERTVGSLAWDIAANIDEALFTISGEAGHVDYYKSDTYWLMESDDLSAEKLAEAYMEIVQKHAAAIPAPVTWSTEEMQKFYKANGGYHWEGSRAYE